jgi:hypothetical protein
VIVILRFAASEKRRTRQLAAWKASITSAGMRPRVDTL